MKTIERLKEKGVVLEASQILVPGIFSTLVSQMGNVISQNTKVICCSGRPFKTGDKCWVLEVEHDSVLSVFNLRYIRGRKKD